MEKMMFYDNTSVTVELHELVESGVKIWDFEYPSFYKGEEKTAFEQKVIDHYYFRQIGQETPARWLHYFRTRIREIMPYYVDLYKTVEMFRSNEDPFEAYNLEETFERLVQNTSQHDSEGGFNQTTSGTRTEASHQNNDIKGEQKYSDTPQGVIVNLDDGYLTNATKTHDENVTAFSGTSGTKDTMDSTSTNSDTMQGEQTEQYHITRRGNIGVQTFGEEMTKHRKAIINIDMMIIDELKDLFLGVY